MLFIWPNKPIRVYDPAKIGSSLDQTWVAQPKWDGKRLMIDCSADGAIRFYGREKQQWGAGWAWLKDLPLEKPWFIDSEWLRDDRIFVWDYAILGGQQVFRLPYADRLRVISAALVQPLAVGKQKIACVETLDARDYTKIMERKGEKGLEGMVWKHLAATNLWSATGTSEVSSCLKYRF